MARSKDVDVAITRQSIIDAAFRITLEEGYSKVTLARLAKEVGLSRSGINGHFAKKEELVSELIPLFSKLLRSPLSFESAEAFKESWVHAISNNKSFVGAVLAVGEFIPTSNGVGGLMDLINDDEQACKDAVFWCIGYASYELSKCQ